MDNLYKKCIKSSLNSIKTELKNTMFLANIVNYVNTCFNWFLILIQCQSNSLGIFLSSQNNSKIQLEE